MRRYKLTFQGREVGAIGVFLPYVREVVADSEEGAVNSLRSEIDFLMWPKFEILTEEPEPETAGGA